MRSSTVTVLLGSPRRDGNSSLLARELSLGVQDGGGESGLFHLHDLDIAPCSGCDRCQGAGSGCVIEDDMTLIYEHLAGSRSVVFAGPVYWFSVSAQTKKAIDRLYAVGGGDAAALRGKRLGIILTYGDADAFVSGASNAVRMFQDIVAYVGMALEGVVCGSALGPGEIRSQPEVLEAARNLGRKLAAPPLLP